MLNMTESGAAQRQNRGSYLRIRYDLDPKNIRKPWAAVIAEGSEYQILALLIENKDTGQHDCGVLRRQGGRSNCRNVAGEGELEAALITRRKLPLYQI
jgi:hypothetical protein